MSNTHLKAKPGFEDIRLAQGAALLKNLDAFLKSDHTLPVIVAV